MNALLAAIRTAPGNGSTPAPAATPELIRDIAPPVDYFPYPTWMVVTVCILLTLLLAVLGYWLYRVLHREPPPPPAARPRKVALEELQKLEGQVKTLPAYEFSIAVSEVLRRFIQGQFHIPAMEETTPEFLEDIADRSTFAPMEKSLLADFLGRCDAVKFGRVEGDEKLNEALLDSATAFVKGGRL